jgi:hypothetical protein
VRTLIDLGAVEKDPAVIEAALESAIRLNEDVLPQVKARLSQLGTRGREGTATLGVIVAERDPDAPPAKGRFETLLQRLLVGAGLPAPTRQLVLAQEGADRYRVDFIWPEHGLVLEADGYRWHSGKKRWQKGLDRGNALALVDLRTLHVSWDDEAAGLRHRACAESP